MSNNVKSIGDFAFSNCSGLTSMHIPNSITSIGEYAFQNCYFSSVTIPNSITFIGENAFYGCKKLTSVNISDIYAWCKIKFGNIQANPLFYSHHLFLNGVEIKDLVIPNSITSIGNAAFAGGMGLTSVTIPSSVTSIEGGAFYDCSGLTSLSIPNKVTYIGKSTFRGCSNLTSMIIPNSATTIGENAFYGCVGLTSVVIPKSTTSIGDSAFYNCNLLTTVIVRNSIPVVISSSTFSNRGNASLYVPKDCKEVYEAVAYWKEFNKIDEEITPDRLSLNAVGGYRGKQVVLPITMDNQHMITGIQCDLYLPAGVTVAKKTNGKMMISTTERMEGNYTLTGEIMNEFVRVIGYSGDGDVFSGNSGDILNITLELNNEMNVGEYTIGIKDIVLSDVSNTEHHPADIKTTLTVKSYTLGDVDDSGAININDVVCIINYILNNTNGTFIPEAADVDENGTININDVVMLINRYILMKESAPAQMRVSQRAGIEANNYLHLVDIDMNPGETKEVQLMMTNAGMVAASQGNIKLPAGLSFVTKSNGRPDVKNIDTRSEDFTLSCALQDDGSMTFAQYSADGFAYTGSEGGIFTFKVKAAEDAAPGTYSVALTGVVLSINGVGYDIPDRTSSLTISETSGIDGFSLDDTKNDGKYYSLDGRMLQGKPILKGIYLNNGKKVVVE